MQPINYPKHNLYDYDNKEWKWKGKENDTALHLNCAEGDINKVKNNLATLAENPAILESKNKDGETPLIAAMHHRRHEIFHLLIEAGADINDCDNDGTALHAAVRVREPLFVKALLDTGKADLEATNLAGNTVFFEALFRNCQIEIFNLLFEAGANVNVCNKYGYSALHLAVENKSSLYLEKMLESAKLTLTFSKKGIGTQYNTDKLGSPLHLAIAMRDEEKILKLLKYVIEHQKDVFQMGDSDYYTYIPTPFILTIEKNLSSAIVEEFIKAGCDVNQKAVYNDWDDNVMDPHYVSPLMIAALYGSKELIQMLIKNEANPLETFEGGRNALYYASVNNNPGVVELFLKMGVNPNPAIKPLCSPLYKAAYDGFFDNIRFLLAYEADVKFKDKQGLTPLDIFMKHVEIIESYSHIKSYDPYDVFDILRIFLLKRASISNETKQRLAKYLNQHPNNDIKKMINDRLAECIIM